MKSNHLAINEKTKDREKSLKDSPGALSKAGRVPSGNNEKSPSSVGSRGKVAFGPPPHKR